MHRPTSHSRDRDLGYRAAVPPAESIRASVLCPGAIATRIGESERNRHTDAARVCEVGEEVVASWMKPVQICDLLLELLAEGAEGRTGHNLGCWVGRPLLLSDSIEAGHRR